MKAYNTERIEGSLKASKQRSRGPFLGKKKDLRKTEEGEGAGGTPCSHGVPRRPS